MALEKYTAMISEVGSDKWTQRATVYANSLEAARDKLKAEHGAGTVFLLQNESDATNKLR